MLRNILAFALALCLTASAASGRNLSTAKPWMDNAHKSSHIIDIIDVAHKRDGFCTATAIGPHALITAEHCFLDDEKPVAKPYDYVLLLDGEDAPVDVASVYRDGADHLILLLKRPAFKNFVPLVFTDPVEGEEVVMWGNPGAVHDQFRWGYVIGYAGLGKTLRNDEMPLWSFDLASWAGDSGAVVFDFDDGHIVGLNTYGFDPHHAGCFPLRFTAQQIAAVSQ